MSIPLNNLYDYIFSLTGHTNKNLIMYRFDPHGSKEIKDLIIHNNKNVIFVKLASGHKKISLHYKLLYCYDQEPLNFDLYSSMHFDEQREKIFYDSDGISNDFASPIGKSLTRKANIAGNPYSTPTVYDKDILLHSEKNSRDLEKYEKNGFIGAYYWSHAFIALDWYRFAKYDQLLKTLAEKNFNKDFNVYARAWTGSREYRLKFLELLNKNNIDKKSNIFFNVHDNDVHYSDHKLNNTTWNFDLDNINSLIFNNTRSVNSSASATYTTNDYNDSAIDVVLETVFDKNKIQLTEKILRPIACGKPFILVSEKDSLKYLKSYGFKTFDHLIDESYDSIIDPQSRLNKIVSTMKNISNLPTKEKNDLFLEMHKIAKENKRWFFSDEFFELINDELIKNLKTAFSILDNPKYQTAKKLIKRYRAHRRYKKYLTKNEKDFSDMIVKEYPERIRLSKKNIGIS